MITSQELKLLKVEEILDHYNFKYTISPTNNANFCCPFHKENNPSFGIHLRTGLFKCFSCGVSGNIVSFVAEIENISYELAEQFIRKTWIQKVPDINNLMATVIKILSKSPQPSLEEPRYSEWLLSKFTKDWSYMRSRGLTEGTCAYFNVVYDPATKFQGFPCYDLNGKLVGITGRNTLNTEPRYHPLIRFKKSKFIYNMHRIDKTKPVIAVEGEINCMAMHQHGYSNTVAFLGASISRDQISIMRNAQIKELILFFDTDQAGDKGSSILFKNLWPYMKIKKIKDHQGDPATMQQAEVKHLIETAEKYVIKVL